MPRIHFYQVRRLFNSIYWCNTVNSSLIHWKCFSKFFLWKQYGFQLKIVLKSNLHTNCNFHSMDIVWIYILWIQCGYTMDIVWIYYGYSMDILWIQYGYTMDIVWIYYGYSVDILWIQYGYTMDLVMQSQISWDGYHYFFQ